MRRIILVATAALMVAGVPVFAQEEHETAAKRVSESRGVTERGPNLFWGWANFLLLAGGLGYVIKKNAGPYFAARSLRIRKGMIEADEARAEAEAKVTEVNLRLANLDKDIQALCEHAKQEQEAELQRARREAEAELAKIQTHQSEEIASAVKAARLELRRYSAGLAIALAEQKIAARMSPEIQDRLLRGFVARMDRQALKVEVS